MDVTSSAMEDSVMKEGSDSEIEGQEGLPELHLKTNHEAKLKELLYKINSNEIKLLSDATKEFIKLLKGSDGGELLRLYVQTSPDFLELLGDWKVKQGKPGMSHVLLLVAKLLSHPDGMYRQNDRDRVSVSRVIDKFCRSFIEDKLDLIYKELNSKEGKQQNAALLLMASIVRRGSILAAEVAKKFNFKLQIFSKLAEYKLRGRNYKEKKHSTRKAFVEFAMSFLEVGTPGLLRSVLQQKEMYSGVLRGLGNDDDETVTYVLSTLRDRVLTEQSLVPPGLRSVLFGSVTLEHLASISGRECGGDTSGLAHDVLSMVCTVPCNGLMPDLKRHPNPLRGNRKRLLDLLKKLKATEIDHHRDLLLAVVRGMPSFGSAYLEEFPYNLEDYASPTWFDSVSLAANLIASAGSGLILCFLDSLPNNPSSLDSDVRNIMKCVCPRSFGRSVINKGLLHSDFRVNTGTLRLLLEPLKLLNSFLNSIGEKEQSMKRLSFLKQEIQNEIRTLLPDPQVLLTLFSSLSTITDVKCLKRSADRENYPENGEKRKKKLKRENVEEDLDIIVAGISPVLRIDSPSDDECVEDEHLQDDQESEFINVFSKLWGFDVGTAPKDAEIFFLSKLLDALKLYLLTIPTALEGSFEFFMNLLSNPLALPNGLQSSLLSLLAVYVRWLPGLETPIKTPPLMYKHLQTFMNLLLCSPSGDIKVQAYNLAQAAMLSTGAFDTNKHEVAVWFFFLPGYSMITSSTVVEGVDVMQSFSPVVISFLCDAISTVGKNLFRYWDALRNHAYPLDDFRDGSPNFSPLVMCVLQKCVRVLSSGSGTFSLPEKSIISAYVCNTLKFLLQMQVNGGLLPSLIRSVLFEGLNDRYYLVSDSMDVHCEWSPLKNLLLFAESVLDQQKCLYFSFDQKAMLDEGCFGRTMDEIKRIVQTVQASELAGLRKAFTSAILCTTSHEIVKNFPTVITISQRLQVPCYFLSSIIFLDKSFLGGVLKLWPKMFSSALGMTHSSMKGFESKDVFDGEIIVENTVCDASNTTAAAAFSVLLRQTPFHVLFPAVMSIDAPDMLDSSKIEDVLLIKLSERSSDCFVSYLCLLLFWFHQIQSSYRTNPIPELEPLAKICYILIKDALTKLLVLESPKNLVHVREVAETIFCHPAVVASLAYPLNCNGDLTEGDSMDSLETFVSFSEKRVHKIDNYVLDILTITFDHLLSPSVGHPIVFGTENGADKQVIHAFSTLVHKLLLELREKVNQCIGTEDWSPLLPPFYALHSLSRFICPLELLELAHWIFISMDANGTSGQKPSWVSAHSVALCITHDAFEKFPTFLQQSAKERDSDVKLIEEIFIQVCKFATDFNLDLAYICMLKALNAVYRQKDMQLDTLNPLSMAISRVIMCTPIEIISHCIYSKSMTKAKILHLLVEMSPLHLSVFGHLLSQILGDLQFEGKAMKNNSGYIMLLPAAMSYLNSVFIKYGEQYYKHFTYIPSFFSKLLLHDWKSFISMCVFEENYDNFLPSSVEDLVNLVGGSIFGKAIHMLQYHLALGGSMQIKERLKFFNSILTCSARDKLLDFDIDENKFHAVNQSLSFINRAVCKISFCRMLLFPKNNEILHVLKETDLNSKESHVERVSNKDAERMRFLKCLVDCWECMVKKFPPASDSSGKEKSSDCSKLYRYLELFILKTASELTSEMCDYLIKLPEIPFLDRLLKSTLLYRFEDPATLKNLCSIMTLLLEGRLPCNLYLQLLLSHSQFAPTIQPATKQFSTHAGVFVKPISSILRFLGTYHPNSSKDLQTTDLCLKQFQIVKLLRVLLRLWASQDASQKDNSVNLEELYLLLLSSYGATQSEIDTEIYNLMLDIESIDRSIIEVVTRLGCLWGNAALKLREVEALNQDTNSNCMTDTEAVEEHRRSQFRENLPVDPRICVTTVLHFPYDRVATDGSVSLNRLQQSERGDSSSEHIQCYDPVFILRFSIRSLKAVNNEPAEFACLGSSKAGYIEPAEFAGLGLLAVAFVSMSSPDIGMRKLGYVFLGRYQFALENSQKKKDIMRLKLLLTFLRNGIEEPWQRIPSVLAVFAAEASFILLDPSHDHHEALRKHLMHSSGVNMKHIPLFHTFFRSNSVNFRAERLWMIRLVCAGLNLDDDSDIFIQNSVIETLLSFYASPLSDKDSKELILQTVKNSVKLHKLASHLVEHCGILPWLSSVLSSYSLMLNENGIVFASQQVAMVTEVVTDVLASVNIVEWLQNYALEQLMELTTRLYKLLVCGLGLLKDNPLVNSILHIIGATLRISQQRKINQPHLTIAFDGVFKMYQTCHACDTETSVSGLKAILMNDPPVDLLHTNREKVSSFLLWAVSTAMKSDPGHIFHVKEFGSNHTIISEEESLVSKLLRWLTASVILGNLSSKTDVNTRSSKGSSSETLLSFLEHMESGSGELHTHKFDGEEVLAGTIFYLQQLLGTNCSVLSSAVCALCLLLLHDCPKNSGSDLMAACKTSMAPLYAKIRCPIEANADWKWSFDHPWKDVSYNPSDLQKIEEWHACHKLLVKFSNIIGKKPIDFQAESYQELEDSVVEWERSIVEADE